MRKRRNAFVLCLITVSLLACTACSGLDRLNENLKAGVAQLSDDVVIGKSNALITPYQSFEGSRTSDSDAFQATYDASVTGFDGQDILTRPIPTTVTMPRKRCARRWWSAIPGTVSGW